MSDGRRRVVVLTSFRVGFASLCLPELVAHPGLTVPLVILNEGQTDRRKELRRRLRKVRQIGIGGAVNGIRMRSWFDADVVERLRLRDIEAVCGDLGVALQTTPRMNCDRTRTLLRESDADVAVSLGNPYIAESVFSIPRFGTYNVHHEVLPEFRGAAPVVWQVYRGSTETGFSIHRITKTIDGGPVVRRDVVPIEFAATLRETVATNVARLFELSARALPDVLADIETAAPLELGGTPGSYTTPSFRQFLEMERRHRQLRQRAPTAS